MLRIRRFIAARILSSTSAAPISRLHRLLSMAAVPPSTSFAVQDYLVETCGLTRAQALKASPKLSHVNSPSNPDAVLAFLSGLGLSSADVAALVVKDPLFLCTSVDRSLAPKLAGLTALGFSHTEIARLASLTSSRFRGRCIVSNLPYYVLLYGSYEKLLQVLKHSSGIFTSSLEKVVKPNVGFLRECGLGACVIAKLCIRVPWLVTVNPERLPAIMACAEGLGVPRGSAMFKYAVHAVAFLSEEKIATQVEYLKNMFKWSDAEGGGGGVAVCKAPNVLTRSRDILKWRSEFLISEVGLEPAYIAHRPTMILYSLEGRLRPRYYVVKFLKENGLLDRDRSYYTAVKVSEKAFMEKFICPHKKAAPYLAEDYATACRGEMPTRFRFT